MSKKRLVWSTIIAIVAIIIIVTFLNKRTISKSEPTMEDTIELLQIDPQIDIVEPDSIFDDAEIVLQDSLDADSLNEAFIMSMVGTDTIIIDSSSVPDYFSIED